jgi:type I site-specific restriction endonuclease
LPITQIREGQLQGHQEHQPMRNNISLLTPDILSSLFNTMNTIPTNRENHQENPQGNHQETNQEIHQEIHQETHQETNQEIHQENHKENHQESNINDKDVNEIDGKVPNLDGNVSENTNIQSSSKDFLTEENNLYDVNCQEYHQYLI